MGLDVGVGMRHIHVGLWFQKVKRILEIACRLVWDRLREQTHNEDL